MLLQNRYDIFLSHNSKDKPLVAILAEQLRDATLNVWLDQDNLYGGDALPKEIEKAIGNSKAALFCIGEHGLGKWQALEMNVCRPLSVNERLKIIVVLLPPLASLPDESNYLSLQHQLYLKWEIGDPSTIEQIIYSVSKWLPIWRDKELKRLTDQRNDTKKKLQEIEENIQQVEREIGIELDPRRQIASAWLSSVRKQVERYARKTLQKFPKLEERIKNQDGGFEIFCTELDTCLEFIYFAFRKREHVFLNDLRIDYYALEFESEDEKENCEVYRECLSMISKLIPSEGIDEHTKNELTSYFNYLCVQVLSLI